MGVGRWCGSYRTARGRTATGGLDLFDHQHLEALRVVVADLRARSRGGRALVRPPPLSPGAKVGLYGITRWNVSSVYGLFWPRETESTVPVTPA